MGETPQEKTFGTRLKHRRMECHLRQIDLARLLGEPQGYVSRWESGSIQYMTLERLRKLARVLQTTTDYLLGLKDDPGGRPEESKSELMAAAVA
jgi:transcriptional regulator with XRE-family HTH domain